MDEKETTEASQANVEHTEVDTSPLNKEAAKNTIPPRQNFHDDGTPPATTQTSDDAGSQGSAASGDKD